MQGPREIFADAGSETLCYLYENSVILKSNDGHTEFEFRVLRYQFPEIKHDEYDSNWLVANIHARTVTRAWSSTDPCMLTWEAHWLLNWLLT